MNCKKIFSCAFCAIALIGSFGDNVHKKEENVFDLSEQGEIINLREEVMKRYYNNLNDTAKEGISFGEFDKGYYTSNLAIKDYSEAINNVALEKTGELKKAGILNIDINMIKSVGGYDADYIISNFRKKDDKYPTTIKPTYSSNDKDVEYDKTHKRCFSIQDGFNPRKPNYYDDNYEYYKEIIKPGDIVFDTISYMSYDNRDYFTHTGIVVNVEKEGYFQSGEPFNFIETIESVGSGVRFGFLDDDRVLAYGTKVLSVRCVEAFSDNVISFMFSQLGKPYKIDIFKNDYPIPDENASTWYCNELVFCAYYHAGLPLDTIDINGKGVIINENDRIRSLIFGDYLYCSEQTYVVGFFRYYNYDFIEFNLTHDSDDTVLIKNNSAQSTIVAYSASKLDWNDLVSNYRNKCNKYIALSPYESVYIPSSGSLTDQSFTCYTTDGECIYISVLRRSCGAYLIPILFREWCDEDLKYEYQIGRKADGTYALKANNTTGDTKTLKTVSSFLSNSEITSWNLPSGCSVVDRVSNSNTSNVYNFSISNNSNNLFPIVEYKSNTDCRTIILKIDKNNQKHTYSETTINSDLFNPKPAVYISISIVKKSGSKWTIKAYNSASYNQSLYYNKKMCFEGDAKTFSKSGLGGNISSKIVISGYSSCEVTINENWFADYITFCVVDSEETYKYVTYAKNLNASKKTMTIYNNRVLNNGHLSA